MLKRVYTRHEIHMICGATYATVGYWVQAGKLAAYTHPEESQKRQYYISEDVEKILEEKNTKGYVTSFGYPHQKNKEKNKENNNVPKNATVSQEWAWFNKASHFKASHFSEKLPKKD